MRSKPRDAGTSLPRYRKSKFDHLGAGVCMVSYSQGIAPFADLFASVAPEEPTPATFLEPLCPQGSSLLDVGAGTGATAFGIASRGVNVVALEPDAEMYAILLSHLAMRHDLQQLV